MRNGKFYISVLLLFSALMFVTGSAWAVTEADVVRLKAKVARGEMLTPYERQLAADAAHELGSLIAPPPVQSEQRQPRNPLDVYLAAEVPYDWVDITDVGTPADIFNDDQSVGPFDLGFDFTYYDQTYSSVFMTSNGWATFTDQFGWAAYFNVAIPDFADPGNAIYIFWDDLYPPSGGEFYYYADAANDRFIMSWINIPHIGTTDELYTFQIILTPDGNMRYNYQLVHEGGFYNNSSCTVGIENATSDEGLQVCYDGTGEWLPLSETSLLIGQPDGVPAPVTNLAATVNDHDVTLTWTDPTQDTNGNPVTLTNIEVWSGAPNQGDLVATVAPGVQTVTLTNQNDGSRTHYVRAYANPYYGGSDHVGVIVGTPSYANNFDTDEGMWTTETGWTWGTPTNPSGPAPYSEPNTWGTDFPTGYPDFADYSLMLDVGLTVASPDAEMEFYIWYDAEFFWDGCNVKISIDGGETWEVAEPDGGYPVDAINQGTANPLGGEPAWSGQSGGWLYVDIPLGQWEGEAPLIRFHFGSDDVVSGFAGVYIDDMIIWGLAEPAYGTVSGNISLDGGAGSMTAVTVRADGLGSPFAHPAANGSYTINNVLVGNRRIRATLDGYHPSQTNIALTESGATGVNLTITRLDPPPASNLTGSVNSTSGLATLNWTASPDPLVDVYNVWRKLSTDPTYVLTGTSATTTFSQTLTVDGIYQYTVTAVDNGVAVPVESVNSNQITLLYGELPVTQLGANGNYDDRIRLSWLEPGIIEGTEIGYDDGSAEQFYVVAFPAGQSDYFCVRMTPPDDASYPLLLYAVNIFVEDQITTPWVGLCPPSTQFDGPDIGAAFFEWTDLHADSTPGWIYAATEGATFLTEPGDFYVVYQFPPNENDQPAVGSDLNAVDSRSYWTQDPNAFWNLWTAHDWMMRAWVGGPPPAGLAGGVPEYYLLSTGTASGYAVERVPTLPIVGQVDNPYSPNTRDADAIREAGPLRNIVRTPVNPLDRWFTPYVQAPEVQLVSREGRETLDDIVNYRVYRGNTMIAQPVETNYTDLNRVENTDYSYHVTAMYDNGIESPSSPVRTARCNMEPSPPTELIGEPVGNTQMLLGWGAPTTNADGTPLVDLAQYKVYRSGDLIATVPAGTTTYTDTPPQNDGFYVWTVTAQDEVPNVSNPSNTFVGAVVSPFESIDYEWVDISGSGTDITFDWWGATSASIEIGFSFPYFGHEYTQLQVSPGGWVSFVPLTGGFFFNDSLPVPFEPHGAIYPFWDELAAGLDGGRVVYQQDDDRFIVSWLDLPHLWDFNFRYTFQLIIDDNGGAYFNYQSIPADGWPGNSDCTVGVEDETSTSGINVWNLGSGAIAPISESAIAFWGGPSGEITGLIREFGSNAPMANVEVRVDQVPGEFVMTDAGGLYVFEVEPGTYTLRVHKQGYCDQVVSNIVVPDDGSVPQNFSMRQPNATFNVTSLNILAVTGQNATSSFEITNPGATCDLHYSITTTQPWLTVNPSTGDVVANQSQVINVTGATASFAPGDYTATINVTHNDNNSPLAIPVTISVTLDAEDGASIPTEYALYQNYPNPFNASTMLRFDVPTESRVEVVLYNVQGQEVARPVDQVMAAGRHQVNYDASSLSTGMYLVMMTAGGFSSVHKMVLLK